MKKFSILIIVFLLIVSCFQGQKTNNQSKTTIDSSKYIFSITKTGYTKDVVNKFHHIRIISNLDINKDNLVEVKVEILKNSKVREMIDSLKQVLFELKLPDSISNKISIEFIDSHMDYCQVHHSDCIFRYYLFSRNIKGHKCFSDIVNKRNVFVNDLPISGYPLDSLLKRLGEPDSVIKKERFDFGEGKHDCYYYGRSFFSVDEGHSNYYLESIDLTSNDYTINLDGFILNKKTMLSDIKRMFPLSFLNMEYDTYKTGNYDYRIRLTNEVNGIFEDTALLLEFKDNYLKRFIYFIEWV